MVTFYLFKKNIKFPQNHIFRMLIKNQIEDFINQNSRNIEEIKVIRTVNSITLQYDGELTQQCASTTDTNDCQKAEIILEDHEFEEETLQNTFEYEGLVSYHCSKCNEIEINENDSEIHEFLKHSTFGTQIQIEIENSKFTDEATGSEDFFHICGFCNGRLSNFDQILLHLLDQHESEVIFQINEKLNVSSHSIDFPKINNYLNFIRESIQTEKSIEHLDYEDKKHFYEVYGDYFDDKSESDQEVVVNVEKINEVLSNESKSKEKSEKISSDGLSSSDKDWIRNEISKSKCSVSTQTGEKRTIYRCSVSQSCHHVSNSSPGLRYHLIMKHLKHKKDIQETKQHQSNEITEFLPTFVKNTSKNCCHDCSLKFKDSRALQLHLSCHDLFETIATYSHTIFPSCNTCTQKFLNEDYLQQHLQRHDNNEDLLVPIPAKIGALREQGKLIGNIFQSHGETNVTDYNWKCGHCESKMFSREEFCNLHLLLFHASKFICPVDKMEFSGFKSVSLFNHHLRNKHSELFPNLSFKCTCCHMEFPTIYDKLQHMKNCERKNLQCDHCDKRFFKKGDLISHLKFVTGEVQHECSICSKKCISPSDLKIHLRSHSKVKPYK